MRTYSHSFFKKQVQYNLHYPAPWDWSHRKTGNTFGKKIASKHFIQRKTYWFGGVDETLFTILFLCFPQECRINELTPVALAGYRDTFLGKQNGLSTNIDRFTSRKHIFPQVKYRQLYSQKENY